jgi:hypothetical protein
MIEQVAECLSSTQMFSAHHILVLDGLCKGESPLLHICRHVALVVSTRWWPFPLRPRCFCHIFYTAGMLACPSPPGCFCGYWISEMAPIVLEQPQYGLQTFCNIQPNFSWSLWRFALLRGIGLCGWSWVLTRYLWHGLFRHGLVSGLRRSAGTVVRTISVRAIDVALFVDRFRHRQSGRPIALLWSCWKWGKGRPMFQRHTFHFAEYLNSIGARHIPLLTSSVNGEHRLTHGILFGWI